MISSDIYADRRVPAALLEDPVLHGECVAGALYWGDFERLARSAGFADTRFVSHHHIERGRVFPVLRQHLEDARRNAFCRSFRVLRGFFDAFRRVCRVWDRKPVYGYGGR